MKSVYCYILLLYIEGGRSICRLCAGVTAQGQKDESERREDLNKIEARDHTKIHNFYIKACSLQ